MFLSKMLLRGVLLCVACGLPTSVYAQAALFSNTVSGHIFGQTGSKGFPASVNDFGRLYDPVTTINAEAFMRGHDFFNDSDGASADANIWLSANNGKLSAFMEGDAEASGYPKVASVKARGVATFVDHLTWLTDPQNQSVPFGTPITVISHVDLTGRLGGYGIGDITSAPGANSGAQDYRRGGGGAQLYVRGTGVETAPYATAFPRIPGLFGAYSYDYWKPYRNAPVVGVFTSIQPAPASIRLTYTAFTGIPFPITLSLELNGNAGAEDSFLNGAGIAKGGFTADFQNTLKWGGIDSVTRADTGEILTGWTVTSASGFDYSKPLVPEPSGLLLVASAVLMLARSRYKRS